MKKLKKNSLKTFRSYCSSYLKESSLTGVASIVQSKDCSRKSLKITILAGSLAGFLYQTFVFLNLYWQYSTVELHRPMERLTKPALTICDGNLIRRRYFCENKPHLCFNVTRDEEVEDSLCNMLKPYCEDPDDIYEGIHQGLLTKYEEEYFGIDFIKEYGFQMKESLVSCEWLDTDLQDKNLKKTTPCSEPKFVRALNADKFPAACYTLGTDIGGHNFTVEHIKQSVVLRIILRWKTSDFNDVILNSEIEKVHRSYYISFHHPGQMSNPFYHGIRVEDGTQYKMEISQTEHIRLPSPYSPDCHDYIQDWLKNGGKEPLIRKECEKRCEIEANFETYGCVPRVVIHLHEKKICMDIKRFDAVLYEKVQKCLLKCKDACLETRYHVQCTITGQIPKEEAKRKYGTFSAVTLDIYFDILKSKMYVSKPKYESIELFSYIGSYMGMWLGWSLVAIFDMFEIVCRVLRYPLLKRRKKKKIGNFENKNHYY